MPMTEEGNVLTNAKHACLHDLSRAHIIIIICSCDAHTTGTRALFI